MKGRYLVKSNEPPFMSNVFADKSALILDWLLMFGIEKEEFSLREAAKKSGTSLGLTQKVFEALVLQGILHATGVRTSKKFTLKQPDLLLTKWLEYYRIQDRCKMKTYRSAIQGKEELLKSLEKAGQIHKVVLALHSAAEAHGLKNTNLNTLELYVQNQDDLPKIEETLQLEPQERGYEVLLIKPYYKHILKLLPEDQLKVCPALLNFLDLYHFPLRGQEQAEFIAQRHPELKRIYNKGKY